MKWLFAALFCLMAVEASLFKSKAKTAPISQNPVRLAAQDSIQSPHSKPVPGIKKWSHFHVIREGNETGKNETKENETRGNETGTNETKGNETKRNDTPGNETGESKTDQNHKNTSSTPQYTIKSVETSSLGTQYLYVKGGEDGGVGTRSNADGDASKWTLYIGPHGGIIIANLKWPDKHLSIIYETEVNQDSWKHLAALCSDDEKCYDEWEFYTLKGAAEGVMMYLIAENLYLEEDCYSNKSPTKDGLWIFDPPLPANMIKGEKEEVAIIGEVFR